MDIKYTHKMPLIPEGWHIEMALVAGELIDCEITRTWAHDDKDPDAPYLLMFLVKDGTVLKDALSAASVEYLQTEDGKQKFMGCSDRSDIEDGGYETTPFTWKKAWDNIPDDILHAHGIMRLPENTLTVHEICTDEKAACYSDAWGPLYQGDEEKEWADSYGFEPNNESCHGDCGSCPYGSCMKLN